MSSTITVTRAVKRCISIFAALRILVRKSSSSSLRRVA